MDFKEKLRGRLRESFGVNFNQVTQKPIHDVEEGNVKMGGEEIAVASDPENLGDALRVLDKQGDLGEFADEHITNKGLDILAKAYQQVNPEAAPKNGQPPANDVGDLSGLTDQPAEPEPEVGSGDEGGDDLDLGDAGDEFDINL